MSPRRKSYQTPEWQRYWADGKASHPDAGLILSPKEGQPDGNRVYAPFRGQVGEQATSRMDQRESWYCHHYRLPGEHYHKTESELEGCER